MRYADVDDGLVQAAPVADVGERHEGVADVDDQGAGVGADGALASGGADLEAADVIVVEDGERGGVAMQAVSMATRPESRSPTRGAEAPLDPLLGRHQRLHGLVHGHEHRAPAVD